MTLFTLLKTSAVLVLCVKSAVATGNHIWNLKKFTSFVTFGDSYTDESRLAYFIKSGGSPPPVGYIPPESSNTATGGRTWVRYVNQYTGATPYNYATSGAVCSNNLTSRYLPLIKGPFPSVTEYQVPAFRADAAFVNETTGQRALNIPADETVYSIYIGTNDLGNNAFLTDSQARGATLADYIDCVYNALAAVYATGARYFVVMNLNPANLLPQYATPENGGQNATYFWPDKSGNLTEISYRIAENVATLNAVYDYRTAFEARIGGKFPGAHWAVFNVNGLLTDIYRNPGNYLNGSLPYNVTGFTNQCDLTGSNCVRLPNPDSFMWFDQLHPSEQTSRVLAREYIGVVNGTSKWATYWAC